MMGESDKRVAAMTEMRYPSADTMAEMERERCSSGPTPKVDNIAARCDRLRIELANTADLATKITGVLSPTSPESAKAACPLDHIDGLLDECFANGRRLRAQLDRIYDRLAG